MGNTQYQTFEDNKHSVDDKIWLLERYLFAMDKPAFFSSLVYSSEIYKYMRYSDYLNNPTDYDRAGLEKELVAYLAKIDNCLQDEILFKKLARDVCLADTAEQRKAILLKINATYFGIDFDRWAPAAPVIAPQGISKGKANEASARPDQLSNSLEPVNLEQTLADIEDIVLKIEDYKSEEFLNALSKFNTLVDSVPDYCLWKIKITKLLSTGGAFKVGTVLQALIKSQEGRLLLPEVENLDQGLLAIHQNNTNPPAQQSKIFWKEIRLDNLLEALPQEMIKALATTQLNKSQEFWFAYLTKTQLPDNAPILKAPEFLPADWKTAIEYLSLRWRLESQPNSDDLVAWLSHPNLVLEDARLAGIVYKQHTSKKFVERDLARVKAAIRKDNFPTVDNLFNSTLKTCLAQSDLPKIEFLRSQLSQLCGGNNRYNKVIAQFAVDLGKTYPNMNQEFSEHELAELRHKKLLRWSDSKTTKSANLLEEAVVKVESCGIKSLTLAIYAIDLKSNYLLTGSYSVGTNTELQGYKPLAQEVHTLNPSSGQILENTFVLSSLIKKLGTYVIEVSGEGLAVRAELKIGNFALVPLPWKHDAVDDEFLILDSNGSQLAGSLTLLETEKAFSSDTTTKIIKVPKAARISETYNQTILVETESGATTISQLTSYRPLPTLGVETIAFPGQVQPEALTQLSFWPYLSHQPVSTERVRLPAGTNLKVSIRARTNHGTEQTTTKIIQVQENGFAHLEYFVAAGLSTVDISLKLESDKYSKPLVHTSSNLQLVVAKLGEQCFDKHFLNLVLTPEYHILTLHGKNGEVYPNKTIQLTLTSLLSRTDRTPKALTDEQGQVKIPRDASLKSIQAAVDLSDGLSLRQNWDLQVNKLQVPGDIHLVEGQEYQLIADGLNKVLPRDLKALELFREEEGGKSTRIELPAAQHNAVKLPTLAPGNYRFVYTLRERSGSIRVYPKPALVSGVHFIKDGKEEQFVPRSPNLDVLEESTIGADRNLKASIHVQAGTKVEAFVILSNTFSPARPTKSDREERRIHLQKNQGVRYLPNSAESPEVKYAKARRATAETRVGSTLSKPTTMLNRKKEKATEPIDLGTSSQHKPSDAAAGAPNINAMSMKASEKERRNHREVEASDWRVWLSHPGRVVSGVPTKSSSSTLGSAFSCVSLDFVVPEGYQQAQVVWTTPKGSFVTELECVLQQEPVLQRNRKELLQSRESNIVEFEEQVIQVTNNYQPDTKNSKSISTLQDWFRTFCSICPSVEKELQTWDFLTIWSSLSIQSQLVLYDKYASHELHIFLYFKDKEFTEEVVKPHLRNKNKKQFVDYFILEETENLKQYLTPFGISRLEFIERILLMVHFREKEPQICHNYVQKLKKQLPEVTPGKQDELRKLFDTILETEQPEHSLEDKYSRKEFIDSFESQRKHTVLKPEYVPQMSGNVSAFNTMGETNEVVDQAWWFAAGGVIQTPFWVDVLDLLVAGKSTQKVISKQWLHVRNSPQELIMALAISDLPFSNPVEKSGESQQRESAGYILCKQRITNTLEAESSSNLLVSQKFFPFNSSGKNLAEEKDYLRVQTAYTLKTVVINGEDKSVKATLAVQLPKGAVPLSNSEHSQNVTLEVGPFKTFEVTHCFYFSEHQDTYEAVEMYPATVFTATSIIGQAAKTKLTVGPQKKVDLDKMLDMFDKQGADEVAEINLSALYPKLKDFDVYQKTLSILKRRFEFDETVWSFSLYHADMETAKEWFRNRFSNDAIRLNQFDIFFMKNDLIDVDYFNFREYSPLTNPRVHDISQYKHNIINRDFLNTYYILLKYFQDKGQFDVKDNISLCVYLLTQDRIDQALEIFAKIDRKKVTSDMKLQFDYLDCYLGFQTRKFDEILELATQYLLYPVLSWRKLFEDVVRQVLLLREITAENNQPVLAQETTSDSQATQLKAGRVIDSHAAFDAELIGGTELAIYSYELDQVKVEYYSVDLELLLASNPAILEERASNAQISVFPNHAEHVRLESQDTGEESADNKRPQALGPAQKIKTTRSKIHGDFINKDTLIRVTNGKKSKTIWSTSTSLKVHSMESHGLLKVVSEKSPRGLAACYVKCMAKKASNPHEYKFYKDGYTDIRGYFDFATLGGHDNFTDIANFALLVVSPDEGSTFLKVGPPSQSARADDKEFKALAEAQSVY